MKRTLLYLMLLCFGTVVAQMQKLGELSGGAFLDSAVIMEEDESDVFGYCLLYQTDRKSKEVFDLEYVILDKNLNKLTSVSLTQAVFKTLLVKTRAELTFAKKIGNRLTIGVNDRLVKFTGMDIMPYFNYRFVNINLDDFSFSKEYKYEGFAKKEFVYSAGDKVSLDDFWNLQRLIKTNGEYFLSFASPEHNPKAPAITSMQKFEFKRASSVKKFAVLDKDLKTVWSKNINADKKAAYQYDYLSSDADVLLLKKEILEDKIELRSKDIDLYDIKKGNLISAIKLEDTDYDIDLNTVSIVKDELHVFVNAHDKSKRRMSMGHGHLVFDKKTGKEISRTYMLWKDMGTAIPGVKEHGGIGDKSGLYVQDFVVTPKGTTVMVLEEYGFKGGFSVLSNRQTVYAMLGNMHLVEYKADGGIAFSKALEKSNSVEVYPGILLSDMKKYGVFDYAFCQKIDKEGNFIMYYHINDQVGKKKKVAKKPLWTLGIISDMAGEFGYEELPLYGDGLKVYPGLAKNGYIKLLEVNTTTGQAEMRLEKVNY